MKWTSWFLSFGGCLIAAAAAHGQVGSPAIYDSPTPVSTGEPLPGPWPTTVSGANFDITMPPGTVLGGTGSNILKVQVVASGPFKWTESRHNEGDIAMVVGANTGIDTSPPADFVENFAPTTGSTTAGWRVNQFKGAAFATVRVNGRDNGDTSGGNPVGTFYGTATFNQGFGQGQSYSMVDGAYTNGGNGAMDLTMSMPGLGDEANISVGTSFFPYAQHWVGGIINGDVADIQGAWRVDGTNNAYNQNRLPAVPPVTWNDTVEGSGRVQFTNGPSPDSGMLFVSSTDDDNDVNVAAAAPRDGGWDVGIRGNANWIDNGVTFSGRTGSDSNFQFLYVPYSSKNLVGGRIKGSDGSQLQGAGNFTVTRSATGEYRIKVPGKTEQNGTLLLSNAGMLANETQVVDNAFLSYQFDAQAGEFVVQSRVFDANTSLPDFEYPAQDTDFYFAWIDFANPLDPMVGDVTGDQVIDTTDIDSLRDAIQSSPTSAMHNLFLDENVNENDLTFLMQNVLRTKFGDLNLDRGVDAADAGQMFAAWGGASGLYADGELNDDAVVDAADAGIMFENWTGDPAVPAAKAATAEYNVETGELKISSAGAVNVFVQSASNAITPVNPAPAVPVGLLTNNTGRVGITNLGPIDVTNFSFGNIGKGLAMSDLKLVYTTALGTKGIEVPASSNDGAAFRYIPEPGSLSLLGLAGLGLLAARRRAC